MWLCLFWILLYLVSIINPLSLLLVFGRRASWTGRLHITGLITSAAPSEVMKGLIAAAVPFLASAYHCPGSASTIHASCKARCQLRFAQRFVYLRTRSGGAWHPWWLGRAVVESEPGTIRATQGRVGSETARPLEVRYSSGP